MGTGKMVSGWRVKDCSRCNGTGIVSRGGVPTIKLPDMGYQTNKFDLKAEVEGTGATRWAVAWGDDISETDAVQGVVAAGVSIYSANPGLFMAWVDALIDRTIDSMVGSAKTEFPQYILSQVRQLAQDASRAAGQGKDAREVSRNYDTVDFKAGAIRYSGRNFVGSVNVSRTWGLKPYVAFRWRASSGRTNSPIVGRDTNPSSSIPVGTRYHFFNSPYVNANFGHALVVDEAIYQKVNQATWRSTSTTHRVSDGHVVYSSPDQTCSEIGRTPDGVILRSPSSVPMLLSNHGYFLFRNYPFRPTPPGIDPNLVTWWRTGNGQFVSH
jgi:hypothetical protein